MKESSFDTMLENVCRCASMIDYTMNKHCRFSMWNDFGFATTWAKYKILFKTIQNFRAIPEIIAESGDLPPRTGIYMSIDDPYASLQFAWAGGKDGKLLEASTFNELGKEALKVLGREKIWTDENAMRDFASVNFSHPDISKDYLPSRQINPKVAPSFIAKNALTSHPSQWCYVEHVVPSDD
jgi:hypothetical protein